MYILPILAGILYLIYSILNRDNLNIYNKRKRNIKNTKKYIKYQLIIAIISSILSILLGVIMIYFDLSVYYIFISPCIIVYSNDTINICINMLKKLNNGGEYDEN